ncbi:MAG TPA: HAMP domain-containing sensor histidine kinase [Streptosporangiaceae bacterium]|jgi:signal transduction histidine kinase|nr:HAMP domain-containing sensor histidine kinase [Streptosporangiaceae bacterium]
MARRIALVVVALVAVLLGVAAIPLGVLTANQDRRDFRADTVAAATTVSSVAEEFLSDHSADGMLARSIAGLRRHGDLVAVYRADGKKLVGARHVPGVDPRIASGSRANARPQIYTTSERLTVVVPVRSDAPVTRLGTVALARSTEPLEHRLTVLRGWLAAVSAAALIAAALIATALARWVSRPLGSLERAAQHLGDGDFSARAPAAAGPPEVRRLAGIFNRMAGRLETLVSGHQAMMADVSHQLRTPLAALRLRLDVLAIQAPDNLAEELSGAHDEIGRLSRMVDGLLAVARAENVTAAPVPVQVEAVIRDRCAAWKPAADEKPVDLSAPATEPLTARMREGHLEQILDNLLANALEAVPIGGNIRMMARLAGDRVRIVVADDGPGMTDQQRQAAFRRFASARPGGTGLGLAIVHRLITADGGTAELSDTPGGGLTVVLDVPAIPRERAARRQGAPPSGDRG